MSAQRDGGALSVSWGKWGGFYWRRGFCLRLCLGWIAMTYIPRDLDKVIQWLGTTCGFCWLEETLKACGWRLERIEEKSAERRAA